MKRKFNTAITAMIGLVFVFALSIAWANAQPPLAPPPEGEPETVSTYQGSVIIENGSTELLLRGLLLLTERWGLINPLLLPIRLEC